MTEEIKKQPASVPARPLKKKQIRDIKKGIVHIQSTFNNTIVTISDTSGNVICSSSAGMNGFKGTKKGTPYAAQITSSSVAKKASELGVRHVEVYVNGPGSGRESAIRSLQSAGLEVLLIKDVTPIPHNGCRPRKRRRV